jgi:endonuclease G, mitochondrial
MQLKSTVKRILSDEKICKDLMTSASAHLSVTKNSYFQPTLTVKQFRNEIETYDPELTSPGLTEFESIIVRIGRPVLLVKNNSFVLDAPTFSEPESQAWKDILEVSRPKLEIAIPAVGRIEVEENPQMNWVGTGWLVANDIIVTNRHVARVFARKDGAAFRFSRNFSGRLMEGIIDFREELGIDEQSEFKLIKVLYIADDEDADIAFFQVERTVGGLLLTQPLPLSNTVATPGMKISVIGYPAADSRVADPNLMRRIFGNVYDVKRMAPGEIIGLDPSGILKHDCSTLGGNSGSVLLDLDSGNAIGLHFAGTFLQANYAVPSSVIIDRLNDI